MEWLGNGASMFPGDGEPPRGPCSDPAAAASSTSSTSSNPHQQMTSSALLGDSVMASLCQSQQSRVKASIISNWRLAEAQDQLCSLGVHSSESLEQERARTMLCPTELSHTEEEWRRKESMLGGPSPSHSPVLGAVGSWDVFDKSIINAQNKPEKIVHERSKPFQQKYEQELRHFGMLRRWDDSQRFLSDQPQLICEETANYLILWCFRLQQEEKEALMEQVAHQAVVMQFILEMATSSEQDPRSCFRQFFHKAKAGQEGYLDVFHSELEAFKRRVKDYTVKSKGGGAPKDAEHQSANAAHRRLDPKEVLETLPPELKAGFQLQDMQILQNVLSTMNPQVAEYHAKRFLEAGLWTNTGRWTKDDGTETDDMRMMETS